MTELGSTIVNGDLTITNSIRSKTPFLHCVSFCNNVAVSRRNWCRFYYYSTSEQTKLPSLDFTGLRTFLINNGYNTVGTYKGYATTALVYSVRIWTDNSSNIYIRAKDGSTSSSGVTVTWSAVGAVTDEIIG